MLLFPEITMVIDNRVNGGRGMYFERLERFTEFSTLDDAMGTRHVSSSFIEKRRAVGYWRYYRIT